MEMTMTTRCIRARPTLSLALCASVGAVWAEPKVDFNKEVKPILADHCFACHGPDAATREAELRLDLPEIAFQKKAWVPGKVHESKALNRMHEKDAEKVMPPPDFLKLLRPEQKETLRRWVEQGATYEKHWAFEPPPTPTAEIDVDAHLAEKLHAQGLDFSEPAAKETWLRRVTLDLTGLPPTLAELQDYAADATAEADSRVVDRLLASKHFGERIATDWLDAARYADSYGRHEDAEMMVWPYRDWVIRAFNENMPYDQFLLWQTAGDLLPNPSQDMLIATAFNRLCNQSNEAGSNEEEFRQELVADRVKTNATAILGLTMECARCHDHKYDPISTKEYYSFAAFLNNIDELGLYSESTAGVPAPTTFLYDGKQAAEHAQLKENIQKAEKALADAAASGAARLAAWKQQNPNHGQMLAAPTDSLRFERVKAKDLGLEKLSKRDFLNSAAPGGKTLHHGSAGVEYAPGAIGQGIQLAGDAFIPMKDRGKFHRVNAFSVAFWFFAPTAQDRAVLFHRTINGLESAYRGYEVVINRGMHLEFALSHVGPGNAIRVQSSFPLSAAKWNHVAVTYDGSSRAEGMELYINGVRNQDRRILENFLTKDIVFRPEWGDFDPQKTQGNTDNLAMTLGNRSQDKGGAGWGYDDLHVFSCVLTAPEVRKLHCGEFPDTPEAELTRYLREHDATWETAYKALETARTAEDAYAAKLPEIMVMRERTTPRETFVSPRGQFDQKGEKVTPNTPTSLGVFPEEFPKNRLGLAKWYVDQRNPLTARVAVNRLWQMLFGKGLVSTQEDFGIQGSLPTHPALLDGLAAEFRDSGWDVKRLLRKLANTRSYRQTSIPISQKLLTEDPENILLGRGPRARLQAEVLRDHALASADLLNKEMGGRSVKPYQPDRLYEDGGVQLKYNPDKGEMIWKRSVYLFRKRTMPLPFLTNFDASTREYCRVRRESTSTPLQALNLLNAPDFVEPCRVLAEKLLTKTAGNVPVAMAEAFERFTSRKPTPTELGCLTEAYAEQLAYYTAKPAAAEALLRTGSGQSPAIPGLQAPQVAALTMVHRLLLNDNESVLKH